MLGFSINEINFDYRKNSDRPFQQPGAAVRYLSPRARQRGVNTGRTANERQDTEPGPDLDLRLRR